MKAEECSFESAALDHLRDALRASSSDRWHWLKQAMAFGFSIARARAAKGLITIGPQGEVLWSPLHETLWVGKGRLPDATETAVFAGHP